MDGRLIDDLSGLTARDLAELVERQRVPVAFERAYWIAPPLLLAGAYPGDKDPDRSLDKLRSPADAGVRTFVNLMEEVEYDHDGHPIEPYESLLSRVGAERGVRHGIASGEEALEAFTRLRRGLPDATKPSPETRAQVQMVLGRKLKPSK